MSNSQETLSRSDLITLEPYSDTKYGTYAAAAARGDITTIPDPNHKRYQRYLKASVDEYLDRLARKGVDPDYWTPEKVFARHSKVNHQHLNVWRNRGDLDTQLPDGSVRPGAIEDPARRGYWLYSITAVDRVMSGYRTEKPEDTFEEDGKTWVWMKLLQKKEDRFKAAYGVHPVEVYRWEQDGCAFADGEKPKIKRIKFLCEYGAQRDYVAEDFLARVVVGRAQDGKVIGSAKGCVPTRKALEFFSAKVLRTYVREGYLHRVPVRVIRVKKRPDGTPLRAWVSRQKWFKLQELKDRKKDTEIERPGWLSTSDSHKTYGVRKSKIQYHKKREGRSERFPSRTAVGKPALLEHHRVDFIKSLANEAPRPGSDARKHVDLDRSVWWPFDETNKIIGFTDTEARRLSMIVNKPNPDWGGLTLHAKKLPRRLFRSKRERHWYFSEADAIDIRSFKDTGKLPKRCASHATTQLAVAAASTEEADFEGVTVSYAAQALDIPKGQITKLCDSGRVRSVGKGSNRRVDLNSLAQYKRDLDRKRLA